MKVTLIKQHLTLTLLFLAGYAAEYANINSPFFSADTAAESKTQGQTKLQPMIRKKTIFWQFCPFWAVLTQSV